jgi:hypothetical protein
MASSPVLTSTLQKKGKTHGIFQDREFTFTHATRFMQYSETRGGHAVTVKGSGTVTAIDDCPESGWFVFAHPHRFNITVEHQQRGGPSVVECAASSPWLKQHWLDTVRKCLAVTDMSAGLLLRKWSRSPSGHDPLIMPDHAVAQALLQAAEHTRVAAAYQGGTWITVTSTPAVPCTMPALRALAVAPATRVPPVSVIPVEHDQGELEDMGELCQQVVLNEDHKNDVIDRQKERLRAEGVPEHEISMLLATG